MPGEINELSMTIGRLEEGMRFLAKQVQVNQETATAEHRLLHDIVTSMSESVRIVAAKVAKMEPLTDDYQEKRAEARGAARLLSIAYVLAGGSFVMAFTKIMEWYAAKPHP